MVIEEIAVLAVSNPVIEDFEKPIKESAIGDLKITDVKAIYPAMRAINSGRLTKNFTFYPRESLVGKKDPVDPYGYASWVYPTGKPVLREHRLQDGGGWFGAGTPAEVPMGRIVYGTYKKNNETQTPPKNKLWPGSIEGDGYAKFIPVITNYEAIECIMGGALHTISIGADAEQVIESISGVDLASLDKCGGEPPQFRRGQIYQIEGKDQLSYWIIKGIKGREISYVNSPSDERAWNEECDIGEKGLRLLMGEKRLHSDEFLFYDAKTRERVDSLTSDECAWDPTFKFVESCAIPQYWSLGGDYFKESTQAGLQEVLLAITELRNEIQVLKATTVETETKPDETAPPPEPEPEEPQTPTTEELVDQTLSRIINGN